MKTTELKNLIKEAVREAIQEELKDILLEAVKSNKSPVVETKSTSTPSINSQDKKKLYEQVLGETSLSFTSQDVPSFKPQSGFDPANGTLPSGNVGMDQIMGLLNHK